MADIMKLNHRVQLRTLQGTHEISLTLFLKWENYNGAWIGRAETLTAITRAFDEHINNDHNSCWRIKPALRYANSEEGLVQLAPEPFRVTIGPAEVRTIITFGYVQRAVEPVMLKHLRDIVRPLAASIYAILDEAVMKDTHPQTAAA